MCCNVCVVVCCGSLFCVARCCSLCVVARCDSLSVVVCWLLPVVCLSSLGAVGCYCLIFGGVCCSLSVMVV